MYGEGGRKEGGVLLLASRTVAMQAEWGGGGRGGRRGTDSFCARVCTVMQQAVGWTVGCELAKWPGQLYVTGRGKGRKGEQQSTVIIRWGAQLARSD